MAYSETSGQHYDFGNFDRSRSSAGNDLRGIEVMNRIMIIERPASTCCLSWVAQRTCSLGCEATRWLTQDFALHYTQYMVDMQIYDEEGHAHFVTFSCYKRRALLQHNVAKRIVLGIMHSQLKKQNGFCSGFVIMPEHVHAIVWFNSTNQLSTFMKQWKQRSSVKIKSLIIKKLDHYASRINIEEPVWQRKYYSFNLYSNSKLLEKIAYMHKNPVRAGLVLHPEDWEYSSARIFIEKRSVGLPIQLPG